MKQSGQAKSSVSLAEFEQDHDIVEKRCSPTLRIPRDGDQRFELMSITIPK
jgi:hypothetical protein